MAIAIATLLAGACSYTLDGDAPEVTVLGEPPGIDPSRLVQLQQSTTPSLTRGADGALWVVERLYMSSMVRLARVPPPGDVSFSSKSTSPTWNGVYTTVAAELTIRTPGTADTLVHLPSDKTGLTIAPSGKAFLTYEPGAGVATVFRRDGSVARTIAATVDSMGMRHFAALGFDREGTLLFVGTTCGDSASMCAPVTAVPVEVGPSVMIGSLSSQKVTDYAGRRFIDCDSQGLRVLPWDGSGVRVLDGARCRTLLAEPSVVASNGQIYYSTGELRVTGVDGASPPRAVDHPEGSHGLGFVGHGLLGYTHGDPQVDAGVDGWLGDWQFMERGRSAAFSRDLTRVRWLEHTAKLFPSGDLMSAEFPRGVPTRLARNVTTFHELDDGRVAAIDDAAFEGPQERLLLIDERTLSALPLARGVSTFSAIPESPDLLVEFPGDQALPRLARIALSPR